VSERVEEAQNLENKVCQPWSHRRASSNRLREKSPQVITGVVKKVMLPSVSEAGDEGKGRYAYFRPVARVKTNCSPSLRLSEKGRGGCTCLLELNLVPEKTEAEANRQDAACSL